MASLMIGILVLSLIQKSGLSSALRLRTGTVGWPRCLGCEVSSRRLAHSLRYRELCPIHRGFIAMSGASAWGTK